MKQCSTCAKWQPRQEFWARKDAPDGLDYTCKPCNRARYKRTNVGRSFNDRRRDVKWSAHLRRNFGITFEQYMELFDRQNGVCAICKEPETMTRGGRVINLGVDHCHDTGAIRGLLCKQCNRAIGQLGDTAERLRSAVAYLEASLHVSLPGGGI